MNAPLISIITITFNSEKTLEETIKSVVSQNYDNLEYIIIDGCSKDKTLDIVRKYRDKISVVISEPDKGISDAFNKGIINATGEIIGIINSDDLLLPEALNVIAKSYESDIDVYRGRTIVWDSIKNAKYLAIPSMKFPVNSLKQRNICHQSTFISKHAYEKYGCFDLNYKYMMDADLLIRFYENGAKMKYIEDNLAVSRLGGVTNSSFWKKIDEEKNLVINNGGYRLVAYLRVMKFVFYNILKNVLFKLFGDVIRKWKYVNVTIQN